MAVVTRQQGEEQRCHTISVFLQIRLGVPVSLGVLAAWGCLSHSPDRGAERWEVAGHPFQVW